MYKVFAVDFVLGNFYVNVTECFVDFVTGNLKKHIACLEKLKEKQCEGEASLQNALELTSQSLRYSDSLDVVRMFITSVVKRQSV